MHPTSGPSRRDFLRAGSIGAGAVGLTLADLDGTRAASRTDSNCILLFLVGGPSQLDTWDLKPAAPGHVRGPFRPIRTSVPGIEISEHFPRMATMAHHYAIVRSIHHHAAPIHETGQQLMQTGRLFTGGREHPHYGAVVSHVRGPRSAGVPAFTVLPERIGNTGVSVSHGQGAAYLGARHEPALLPATHRALDLGSERTRTRDRYGRNRFGESCLQARRLIEAGVRLVTVNMFATVFDEVTWDCHADGGSLPSDLNDYQDTLCPMFDLAYSALLDDLSCRGLLSNTLVVAMGEFGRTPHLNPRGGRDHWPGVWSMLFAGAGIRGGQVVGSSDRLGGEPKDRPISPAELAATIYRAMGIDLGLRLQAAEGKSVPLVDARPVSELLR